jgi:hypothetical protein
MNRRIGATVLGVTCALVTLAGCHSSTTTTGTGTTTTGTTATGAGGTTSTPNAGAAKPIDVCSVLSATLAAQLSGQPITTADPQTNLRPNEYGCAYGNDDDSLQVEVTVFEHDAATSYGMFLAGSPQASQINGLGDKAFFDNDGTMYVLDGAALVQVNGLTTADACAALAKPVLAAL